MTRTPIRIALSVFALMMMAIAGFGQPRIGTRQEITGTWSGIFALKNPNGTVSHNQVVVKLEVHEAEVTGSIGSTIDSTIKRASRMGGSLKE